MRDFDSKPGAGRVVVDAELYPHLLEPSEETKERLRQLAEEQLAAAIAIPNIFVG